MKRKISLVSLLLLAVLAMSGQHVDYRFTPHYNERVDSFELMTDLDSTSIVMLGNSLTEFGGDWNSRLGTTNVVNRGIIGDDALGMTNRLVQILPHRPKAVFLLCGTNDLSHGLTADEVFQKVRALIDTIRAGAPQTRLYVQSLLPINESFGRWKTLKGRTNDIPEINRLLRQYCREQQITYINLFPHFTRRHSNVLRRQLTRDGLHLSPDGYRQWAARLQRYIHEINK